MNGAVKHCQTCCPRQRQAEKAQDDETSRHVNQTVKQPLRPAVYRFFPHHLQSLKGAITNHVFDLQGHEQQQYRLERFIHGVGH